MQDGEAEFFCIMIFVGLPVQPARRGGRKLSESEVKIVFSWAS